MTQQTDFQIKMIIPKHRFFTFRLHLLQKIPIVDYFRQNLTQPKKLSANRLCVQSVAKNWFICYLRWVNDNRQRASIPCKNVSFFRNVFAYYITNEYYHCKISWSTFTFYWKEKSMQTSRSRRASWFPNYGREILCGILFI